jgi:hypothetical protein
MASNNSDDAAFSVSLPVGAAVAGVLLATTAAAAFLLLGRNEETEQQSSAGARASGKSFFRRIGILGLVTLIENDTTRKVVVAILKAMARRA